MEDYEHTDDETGEAMVACEKCDETWPEGRIDDGRCPDCSEGVSCQFCGDEATTTVLTSVRDEPPEDTPACDECADREGYDA